MLEFIIKKKYGYTLNKNRLVNERCPRCNGFVYRTNENPLMCFCTSAFCSFHDTTDDDDDLAYWQRYRIKVFKIAMEDGRAIYLHENKNYPEYHHCVIRKSDVINRKYIVREWEPGEGKYLDLGYDKASRIVRTYSSLEKLVADDWKVN